MRVPRDALFTGQKSFATFVPTSRSGSDDRRRSMSVMLLPAQAIDATQALNRSAGVFGPP
jgi:hypothetical protein